MEDTLPIELGKKAIEESAKIAEKFLAKLVEPPLVETGGILNDTVKFWRFKNQINLVLKAQAFLISKGIDPVKVLPKTLVPILDHGSLEEDLEMQERWSALLAHAADPKTAKKIPPSYPEILKQISPFEARLLDNIYESTYILPVEEREKHGIVKEKVLRVFSMSENEYDIIVDNLIRLGLCQWPTSKGGMTIGDAPVVLQTYDFIKLSPLGRDFVEMCKYN